MKILITIFICLLLILNSWKNILQNVNTHLPGWYDELFIIWIYQNNVKHFSNLDFTNIYETNALYPLKYTLSFAEQMYFPSFLILVISIFTKNIIAQYNILLILNHLLIFVTGLLFFRKILKGNTSALISTFYITFSPYFFRKIGHFQMIFFWPMLISLYFLAHYFERGKTKILILCGIFAGIQFLSSVYLGVMNLTIIFLWYITKLLYQEYTLRNLFKQAIIVLTAFIFTTSVSLLGYFLVNNHYQIKRDYGEYVTYSANLTDYLFPVDSQASLLYKSYPIEKIKSYNHHSIGEFAAFAGFLPLVFMAYQLWPRFRKIKENLVFNISLTKIATFSLLLIFSGFILSLGPRLFVNGQYTEIPLPYDLFLKIFHPIGIIRAVARWHFLVILGFAIFLGIGYLKFERTFAKTSEVKKNIIFFSMFILVFIEFYSLTPFQSHYKEWQADKSYKFLSTQICKDNSTTLLEYPFHYRNLDGDIVRDVNYMAQILLNSTRHNCKILSGYYGYEPPVYIEIKREFENGFDSKDIQIIENMGFEYLKFNKYALSEKEFQKIKESKVLEEFQKIYDKDQVLIYKL